MVQQIPSIDPLARFPGTVIGSFGTNDMLTKMASGKGTVKVYFSPLMHESFIEPFTVGLMGQGNRKFIRLDDEARRKGL